MWATKVHRRLGTMSLRMTCVISFYYGNSHTHCGKRLGTIIPWTRRNATLVWRFYTETLLHTEAFTHRHFYTQTLSHRDVFYAHTDVFSHAHTRTLLHTDPFTHILFYTETLLHIKVYTHRSLYTQTLLQTDIFTRRPFYTQTRLHAEAFTPRRFSTQTLLHTDSRTHRRSYRQNPLHTGAFTGRRFCKTYQHEMMLWNRSETSWLRSANLSAKHSAGRIPPKTSIKNPGRCQTGARATSEIADCTIMHSRSLVPRWDRLSSSSITQTHVDEHFPFFELLAALMRVHMFVTNSLYRQTTAGYWFSTFATNSFSRRTVMQINLCPPHSVPCATRHANLRASTKPPRLGAIVRRAQGMSFLKQQLDGILCRVAVTHNKPST